MRDKAKEILNNPFISASAIVFSSSLLGSALNFFFNLFMSRNLSAVDYGILASLTSLTTVSSLFGGWIMPTVVHFGASYFAKHEFDKVRGLFIKIIKISFLLGFLTFGTLFVFQREVGQFLNIDNHFLIFIVNISVFLGILSIANIGLLQAKLAFTFLSFITLFGGFFKLLLGIAAVFIGFGVGGVMWGILIAALVPYILTFGQLQFLFKKAITTPHIGTNQLLSYGIPAALALYGLSSLINTDIILVKHFFDPQSAGIYSRLSLVGRVIFFFSAPLGTVMFPLIAQRQARKENYNNIFKLALLLVLISSLGFTLLYFLFPTLILPIFFNNNDYLSVAPILGFFGIFITIYSLLAIMINYYLSIRKTKVFIPITIAVVLQAIFIWIFHATFLQIIFVSIGVTSLLILVLFVYYWRSYEKK